MAYLIRHGEIENPQQVLYGRLPDFSLSEKGRQQAEEVAKTFPVKPDAVYVSPQLRAQQTAQPLCKKYGIEPIVDARIDEIRTHFQGILLKDMPAKDNIYFDGNWETGDETIEEIFVRTFDFLQEIGGKHNGKHIAVFSHGDPIVILREGLVRKITSIDDIRENYPQKGSVTILRSIDGTHWLPEGRGEHY